MLWQFGLFSLVLVYCQKNLATLMTMHIKFGRQHCKT
jgi:hypothetical protein